LKNPSYKKKKKKKKKKRKKRKEKEKEKEKEKMFARTHSYKLLKMSQNPLKETTMVLLFSHHHRCYFENFNHLKFKNKTNTHTHRRFSIQ
jgi:hypothetical protein